MSTKSRKRKTRDVSCSGCYWRTVVGAQEAGDQCTFSKCEQYKGKAACDQCLAYKPHLNSSKDEKKAERKTKKARGEEKTPLCHFCSLDNQELAKTNDRLSTHAGVYYCCNSCALEFKKTMCAECAWVKKSIDFNQTCDLPSCSSKSVPCSQCKNDLLAKEVLKRVGAKRVVKRIAIPFETVQGEKEQKVVAEAEITQLIDDSGGTVEAQYAVAHALSGTDESGKSWWDRLSKQKYGVDVTWAMFNALRHRAADQIKQVAEAVDRAGNALDPTFVDENTPSQNDVDDAMGALDDASSYSHEDTWQEEARVAMVKAVAEVAKNQPNPVEDTEDEEEESELEHEDDCDAKPGQMCACGLKEGDLKIAWPKELVKT